MSISQSGFAIHADVIAAAYCDALIETLGLAAHRSRAGVRHCLSIPGVNELAHSNAMLDLARSVLPSPRRVLHIEYADSLQLSDGIALAHD